MGTNNVSVAGQSYLATYDPSSKKVTKLTVKGFNSPRGLSSFGMDIVPSTHNPDELTIYVTNIRPPLVDLDMDLPPGIREAKRDEIASARSKKEGPDPSIEVFRYLLGGDSVQHIATWTDERVVISPNDVVGLPDGKGVWFTNPVPYRAGIVRLQTTSPTVYRSLIRPLTRQTLSLFFFSRTLLRLGSVGQMGANLLQPGCMALTGSHDLRSPQMTRFTLPTPSLVA
jgi:hypothetical protein